MNEFTEYIKELYQNGFGAPIEYWLITIMIIVLILAIVVKLFINSNNQENSKSSLYFRISLTNIKIISCLIGITLLSAIVLYIFFYQDYFVKQHFALDLIVLIFALTISFIIIIFRFYRGVRTKLPKYISPSISLNQKIKNVNYINKSFEKSKWSTICVIIPFSLLLFHSLIKPEAEISILIDNSGSTDMYIEYGKSHLAESIENIYDDTKFNISYFETFDDENICKTKFNTLFKDANKIVLTNNIEKLSGNNIHFNSSREASIFFKNNNIEHSCIGTPLLESLWSNYLSSIQNTSKNENVIKILILLTDGQGNLYIPSSKDYYHTEVPEGFDIFNETSSINNISMYEYYDEISIINIGENDEEGLFYNFQSQIYDGQDEESYKKALKIVTKNIQKRNWNFIYILATFALIVIIIFMSIKIRPIYKQIK